MCDKQHALSKHSVIKFNLVFVVDRQHVRHGLYVFLCSQIRVVPFLIKALGELVLVWEEAHHCDHAVERVLVDAKVQKIGFGSDLSQLKISINKH